MKHLRAWWIRFGGLLSHGRRERELADEIESHLRMHIDDNLRAGMTPADARREALLKFGGIEATKEAWRDRGTVPVVENLIHDTRFALRQLRKNPGFSATAILMLALGICASVAIFAFVEATLLRPLPYRDPARLVELHEKVPLCPHCPLSYYDYQDWKRLNTVFSSMDLHDDIGLTLTASEGAQQVPGARVTAGFFRTLGVAPILGRDFVNGEDQPQAPRTVLLSYAAWQSRYGGRPDVLGQTVTLNSDPHTIIGVLPRDFHFALTGSTEFWISFHQNKGCDLSRGCHSIFAVARLKDGVSPDAASANIQSIAQQLEAQYPDSNRGQGGGLMPLAEAIVGDIRPILLVLLCGAGLLLLIACVNVASLLLVRSETRSREFAVRSGLGASRARLVSQFVTEGLVLVAFGAAIGLVSTEWTMHLLKGLIPSSVLDGMPYLHAIGWNARVCAFAVAVSLLAAFLFSAIPALRLGRSDLRAALAEGSRGSAGTVWRRFGANLVVVELATAMVLLVGAGLLGKSLYRLLHVDIGMQPDHLATMHVAGPETTYSTNEKTVALGRRVLHEVERLPGVESVALSSRLPVVGGNTMWIQVVGKPYHGEHNEVSYRQVTAGYFTTLKAKLLRGRYFRDDEDASKPRVMIISEAIAKKYFPGEDPLGKQIQYAGSTDPPMEVIGILEDIKEGPLDRETWPTIYVAFNQDPTSHFAIVARTSQSETSVLPAVVRTIHQIDPGISTFHLRSMNDRISESPAAYMRRVSAWLVGGFAAIALLLGVVGLYGVIAYSVSQRTREIGVRMALGAQQSTVYSLILREAGWLIVVGIAIGLVCSVAASRLLGGLLFGIRSWDVPTLVAVATLLGISTLLASYLPARRAASVNPVDALRAE